MGPIVCATRGGEASYRTQDAAIALAQEHGDELLFLYVVDVHFLDKTARAVRPDVVSAEMEKMGEFLLAMAQERAQRQEVTASYIPRHGDLNDELKKAAREPDVELVVLGKPASSPKPNRFIIGGGDTRHWIISAQRPMNSSIINGLHLLNSLSTKSGEGLGALSHKKQQNPSDLSDREWRVVKPLLPLE